MESKKLALGEPSKIYFPDIQSFAYFDVVFIASAIFSVKNENVGNRILDNMTPIDIDITQIGIASKRL